MSEEMITSTILTLKVGVDGCLEIVIGDELLDEELVGERPSEEFLVEIEKILAGDSEFPDLQATIIAVRERFEEAKTETEIMEE